MFHRLQSYYFFENLLITMGKGSIPLLARTVSGIFSFKELTWAHDSENKNLNASWSFLETSQSHLNIFTDRFPEN